MLANSRVLIVTRPRRLQGSGVHSWQYPCPLRLREEAAGRVLQSGAQVRLGLSLPPARRLDHLVVERLSAVWEESRCLPEQPSDVLLNLVLHGPLIVRVAFI